MVFPPPPTQPFKELAHTRRNQALPPYPPASEGPQKRTSNEPGDGDAYARYAMRFARFARERGAVPVRCSASTAVRLPQFTQVVVLCTSDGAERREEGGILGGPRRPRPQGSGLQMAARWFGVKKYCLV